MQLVYLSPVPWASFAQRPHKFVEWFHARHGDRVLWIDPYPTRFPELSDLRRIISMSAIQGKEDARLGANAWLTVLKPRSFPIEPGPGSGAINRLLWTELMEKVASFVAVKETCLVIGKPSELALQLTKRHRDIPRVYDAMDDFAAFYGGFSSWAMRRREDRIAANVSMMLASSTALVERFSGNVPKPVLARNACATEVLPDARVARYSGEPVFGYVGTIANWFDWPLVIKLAMANPETVVRLIGPVYSPPSAPLPKNIELVPACPHPAAIEMMQNFSAGLIPFKINALTSSVDPIKYYEYRARGLPVISTSFGEMTLRENLHGVSIINHDTELHGLLRQVKNYQPGLEEIRNFRSENSWYARFDALNLFGNALAS
jgi:hypothetical protein